MTLVSLYFCGLGSVLPHELELFNLQKKRNQMTNKHKRNRLFNSQGMLTQLGIAVGNLKKGKFVKIQAQIHSHV